MDAKKIKLLEFLNPAQQFTIPIYQRKYSWTLKECGQLWDDILKIGNDEEEDNHFVGSIVYMRENTHIASPISTALIIDGQQRLTTITLLICAMAEYLKNNPNEELIKSYNLLSYYVINDREEGEKQYKLVLTDEDKESLTKIIYSIKEGNELNYKEGSHLIMSNYKYFQEKITEDNIKTLFIGLNKLIIIHIGLEQGKDNPQLIFESLNSTGLELKQVDLIRNYILMGLKPAEQEELYNMYWRKMERGFERGDKGLFDRFIRDYLTIKLNGNIPKKNSFYNDFKVFSKTYPDVKTLVKEVYHYAKIYFKLSLGDEEDLDIRLALNSINEGRVDVARPFLMNIYDDYENNVINKTELLDILKFTESYIIRRAICDVPSRALNKIFATLYYKIDKNNYVNSLKAIYMLEKGNGKFPTDKEVIDYLVEKDFYHSKRRILLLNALENYDDKEKINVENCTIEHILPQTLNLSDEWKNELGENWKEVQKMYVHTLGNLTLTGYNPELGAKSFKEKKEMNGGYANSKFKLSRGLSEIEVWNKDQIIKRTKQLSNDIIKIWPYPDVDELSLDVYQKARIDNRNPNYIIETQEYLQKESPMRPLFDKLSTRLLNLNANLIFEVKDGFILFKDEYDLLAIKPHKENLTIILNIPFKEIKDDKWLCKDVTNLNKFGDTLLNIDNFSDLDYVVDIIKQVDNYHSIN